MPTCNLCGFPVVRLHPGSTGSRCVRCLSTFRHRAMGLVLAAQPLSVDAAVYELSSRGALCRYLRRRFRSVTVSELFDDVPAGGSRDGVACQDVQRLTYADGAFDLVTSTEVFEHVPDDARAFREVYRVLRPGGLTVFTVPIDPVAPTLQRAAVRDGHVVHLVTPEYHGDRLRGQVLAFRTYGVDVVERVGAAGFEASLVTVDEPAHAIAAARVVVGRKPA